MNTNVTSASVTAPAPQPLTVVRRATPAPPAPVRGNRARWLTIIIALALTAVGVEAWRTWQAPVSLHYITVPVTRGAVTRAISASGSVNPVTTIQVGTYVSGVIENLYCDYNTQVRKGQLCAKIDARPYQSIVDQYQANLSTAKAQLAKDQTNRDYAKLSYDRAVSLRGEGLVSQDQLDSAKSAFDQATAQTELDKSTIDQHQAALSAAALNVAYTNIVSPVNGTVVSRNVTMGQTVAASFQTPTLFLIATDLTQMQVDANVSESDIGGIAPGKPATFTVEAFPNHMFQGRVTQVRQAPQTVQNVVTYDVVISVPNPELLLKPGMTATVRIIVDRRDNVIRVSDRALRYRPGGLTGASSAGTSARSQTAASPPQAWVLRDGRPVAIPLTVGLDDDTNTEIVRGELKAGDQVITSEQAGGGSSSSSSSRLPFFRL